MIWTRRLLSYERAPSHLCLVYSTVRKTRQSTHVWPRSRAFALSIPCHSAELFVLCLQLMINQRTEWLRHIPSQSFCCSVPVLEQSRLLCAPGTHGGWLLGRQLAPRGRNQLRLVPCQSRGPGRALLPTRCSVTLETSVTLENQLAWDQTQMN